MSWYIIYIYVAMQIHKKLYQKTESKVFECISKSACYPNILFVCPEVTLCPYGKTACKQKQRGRCMLCVFMKNQKQI